MKLGSENRNKVIAAGVLMAVALLLVLRVLFGSGDSAPTVAATTTSSDLQPTTPRPLAHAKKTGKKKGASVPHSLDPELRYDWLKTSEDTKYEGNGRNIFSAQAPIPQPVAPAATDQAKKQEDTGPPPPPPPPPITLKFFGFASKAGEPRKVFLSQGEDVFIAGEGDVVNRHYKVLHISPSQVEIEDVLNNNRQQIPLSPG
jgi:hypothetical protein